MNDSMQRFSLRPVRLGFCGRTRLVQLSSLVFVICGLAGCNVGSKYLRPVVPAPPAFKESNPQELRMQYVETCAAARCRASREMVGDL